MILLLLTVHRAATPMISPSASSPPPLPRSVLRAYVCAKLAIACLETLFSLFSIDLFLNVYALSTHWFFIGQSIYVVWNAVNDPLFAWFQDRATAGAGAAGANNGSAKIAALKFGGPLMGLAFLVPFIPLSSLFGDGGEVAVGLHFLFALCFFDGVFTYAALAHCALFAEITTQAAERMQVMRIGEVSMLATAPVVWMAQSTFDRSNLSAFRWFSFALAVICAALLWVSADYVQIVTNNGAVQCREQDGECATGGKLSAVVAAPSPSSAVAASSSSSSSSSNPSLRTFLIQFLSHRSILLFIAANFLQVFTLAFFNGFFTIIVDSIQMHEGDAADTAAGGGWAQYKSLALGLSQLLPPLIILALSAEEAAESFVGTEASPPASAFDRAYRVVRGLTFLKIVLSLGMLMVGVSAPLLFLIYLFLTRALATATFAFFTPLVSDCIDEDSVAWKRARPFSASFFGINALLTKPAQSIAPVLTVGLWNKFGFRAQQEGQNLAAAAMSTEVSRDPIRSSPTADELAYVVFLCCTVGPLLIGLVQAILWSLYTLRGDKLRRVKQQLAEMQSGSAGSDDASSSSSPESLRLRSAEEGTTATAASGDESSQLLDKRRVASKQS